MNELKASGQLTAATTWQSIYPVIEADERFEALLGIPGSSPLDLFWDVIDVLELAAEEEQRVVEDVFSGKNGKVEEGTTFEEFSKMLEGDEKLKEVDYAVLQATFEKVRFLKISVRGLKLTTTSLAAATLESGTTRKGGQTESGTEAEEPDGRFAIRVQEAGSSCGPRVELRRRKLLAVQPVTPPILTSLSRQNLPRIKETPEFISLSHDEASQRSAFEKFIKRQKEKLKDMEVDERRHSSSHSHRRRERSVEGEAEGGESRAKRRASEDTVEGMALPRHKASRLASKKAEERRREGGGDAEMKEGNQVSTSSSLACNAVVLMDATE